MTTITTESVTSIPEVLATPTSSIKKQRGGGFGPFFWFCCAWLAMVTIFALFGKWLPFADKEPDYAVGALINGLEEGKDWKNTFSSNNLLGTDENGNDILANLILGARNSVIIAFATVILGFLMGGGLGMIAGYARGRVDGVMSFFTTALQSFPGLLFILLFLSITSGSTEPGQVQEGLSTNVWKLSMVLGVLSIPTLFRVVRASTILYANREFVMAARAMGTKTGRILMREILPNVAKPMLAYGLVAAGGVMVLEGSLSFLGVGVGDSAAWGKMIQSGAGISGLKRSPHVVFVPMAMLFMTVLAFNYIGDQVRAKLEVKQAGI
jgi:peptide/nickel transport system permease protein